MLRHSLLDWTGRLATCETHLLLQTIIRWCDMFPFMLPSCHSPRSSGRGEKNCEKRLPRCPTHIVMPCPDIKWAGFMFNHLEHTHHITSPGHDLIDVLSHNLSCHFMSFHDISFLFVSCQFFQIHPSALTFCPRDRRGRTLEGHLQNLALYKSS